MRNIPAGLQAKIEAGSTTLCRVWTITRRDGTIRRFTDLDDNLLIGANTYRATDSFTISDITISKGRGAQAADMRVLLDDDVNSIDWDDVLRGLYDRAQVTVEVVDYEDTSLGSITLFDGFVGASTTTDKNWGTLELTGRLQASLQNIGDAYTAECPHDLGDGRCKFVVSTLQITGTVFAVTNNRDIEVTLSTDPANHFYSFGTMTWTSGDNNGSSIEVLTQIATTATEDRLLLALSTAKDIQVGDTFDLFPGCDKAPTTCRDKFTNIANYGGFPFVPGPDIIKDPPKTNTPVSPSGGIL